jgi:hypothetical protein
MATETDIPEISPGHSEYGGDQQAPSPPRCIAREGPLQAKLPARDQRWHESRIFRSSVMTDVHILEGSTLN